MKNQINYSKPFSGFNAMSFSNCFSGVYMHLENISGDDDYDCKKHTGENCDGCGNCGKATDKLQEDYYFLFDTLSGRSSVRPDFNGGDGPSADSTPEAVDFLIKFAGYSYSVETQGLPEKINSSVDAGIPVIVRVASDNRSEPFRVITGYDGDSLIMADPSNAQNRPGRPPEYSEILEALIIHGKSGPVYTLADGLKRIRSVMIANRDKGIWDGYIRNFKYWDEKLADAEFDEIKRRINRICSIAWHNFNCHNFAETFRHRITDELKDSRLDPYCRQISESYDNSHTRNWQIIALNDCRDWSGRRYNELEWGYCTCVLQCLEELRKYDEEVLAAVWGMIGVLG